MGSPRRKILSLAEAGKRAAKLKALGKRLVTVNGSFDLLHAGHLAILEEAKRQGDTLFVGVNSDAAVRQYKGPDRPIVPEAERARLLAALTCVDYVVVLDEKEAGGAIIRLVQPHVHANGSEYGPPEQWVEYPVMREYGVAGVACARRTAHATSDLIRKIRSLRAEPRPANSH